MSASIATVDVMISRDPVSARTQRVHARGRVVETLMGVALDLVAPYASDYLSPEDYTELVEVLEDAVARSADLAVSALADDVERSMLAADPRLAARVESLRRWHG